MFSLLLQRLPVTHVTPIFIVKSVEKTSLFYPWECNCCV